MKNIYLEGALATPLGGHISLDVASPLEAVRALIAQVAEFRRLFVAGSWTVFVDGEPKTLQECRMRGGQSYRFAPPLGGAGGKAGGAVMTVLGAALVIGSFMVPGLNLGLGPVAMAALQGGTAFVGSTLLSLGTSQLLAQDPAKAASDRTKKNWVASSENTSVNGSPVPVIYGIMKVGGIVISSELVTEKLPFSYRSISTPG